MEELLVALCCSKRHKLLHIALDNLITAFNQTGRYQPKLCFLPNVMDVPYHTYSISLT